MFNINDLPYKSYIYVGDGKVSGDELEARQDDDETNSASLLISW